MRYLPRCISLVAQADRVLHKVVAGRLGDCCKWDGNLPQEQCGFGVQRLPVVVMFEVSRLQELAREKEAPCTRALSILPRTTTPSTGSPSSCSLWRATDYDNCRFHDGAQACECSDLIWLTWSRAFGNRRCL